MAAVRNADIPRELLDRMEGPFPPDDFESDGISFVTNWIIGEDLRAAGHFHDYAYHLGKSDMDRELADYRFYRNLRHLDCGKLIANIRFLAVRILGFLFFTYDCGVLKGWRKVLRRIVRGKSC